MKCLLLFMFVIFSVSCKSSEAQKINQGIKGNIRWFEGNLMPGPDNKATAGKPVQRTIHIYELVSMNTMNREGELFKEISSKLVKKIETDENGYFETNLPPGQYSLFTQEENGLFANVFDGEGNINPVTIKKGEVAEVKIDINYKAFY